MKIFVRNVFRNRFQQFLKLYIVKSVKKWYIISDYGSFNGSKVQEREDYAMSKREIVNKLDDILENAGVNELLGRKKAEEKKANKLLWVLAIIGAIAVVAAIAYAVYRYLTPDYLEDFEDDFDDDFDDDFFDNEDEEEAALEEKKK